MNKSNTVTILSDLIAIPSVNAMGQDFEGEMYSENNVVDYCRQRLQKCGLGVEVTAQHPRHANIVAHLDVGAKETVVLDAHLDTVSHLNMSIDPFDPLIKDGKLHGRGSCDTKSSMAVFIAAMEHMETQGKKPTRNVIITGCSQEEHSFAGIEHVTRRGIKADFAIIGEPTDLHATHAHMGVYRCFIRAEGVAVHSSKPDLGINAIYLISEATLRLRELHRELQKRIHPLLGRPSLSVGMIKGGTTVNTVPPAASIEIDRRMLPGETAESVHAEIVLALKGLHGISVDQPYTHSGGYEEPSDSRLCEMMKGHCLHHGHHMQLKAEPYATHAPFFKNLGIPSLVFGPGSLQQAHTKDEFVRLDQLEKAQAIIESLLLS